MHEIDLEKNFFGRDVVLSLLNKRITDLKDGYRQNIALIGNKYVGKSTILRNFVLNLDESDVTVIYLELENKDFSYFLMKFIGSLLYGYSKNERLPLYDDTERLIQSTKAYLPNTIAVIERIMFENSRGRLSDAFLGLLTLPEVFTNETGKFCILILDEFQNLEDFLFPNAFLDLGKKIMTQKRCFYIVSSSCQKSAEKILSEKLSLLFGNFETINVDVFDLSTSQDFIKHNLQDGKIGLQLRNFLTDFTGGHPLYLSLICKELINLSAIHRQAEVYMPILIQAIENTMFDKWGVINRHFELIVNDLCAGRGNQVLSPILLSISSGNHKLDVIAKDLNLKKSLVSAKVNKLIDAGVIVKNGTYHYFKDKLFKYWIRCVYSKRMHDVELSPDKQRKEFKEELNVYVEHFNINSRKDFSSRIAELLGCFDNEAFQINGRKYKLPGFQEIVPFKLKNDQGLYVDVIKADTAENTWFIALKKDLVSENDVSVLLKESRRLATRPQRCVLIAFSELDENTRVKALQEKFWIWHEQEVNTLLTLFDKPYIV